MRFKQYLKEQKEHLEEKVIILNRGAKFGQVVFLAGGAGSGKGFARDKFIDISRYKVFDPDDLKKSFQRLDHARRAAKSRSLDISNPRDRAEISNLSRIDAKKKKTQQNLTDLENIGDLDLKNPKNVGRLHMFVKARGAEFAQIDALLRAADRRRLPNIVFDMTFKEFGKPTELIKRLVEVGYDPNDMHLVWVLTNYSVAVQANKTRDRVVPDDILLQTHQGAALTVSQTIWDTRQVGINGEVHVILGNHDETIHWKDSKGKEIKNSAGKPIVARFTSAKIKDRGKSSVSDDAVKEKIHSWIISNVPKTKLTKILWPDQKFNDEG